MEKQKHDENEIPELNSKVTYYPSLGAEIVISQDYSTPGFFTAEELEARTRYYTLLEKDPELVPRQRQDLEKIIGRGVFELWRRSQGNEKTAS